MTRGTVARIFPRLMTALVVAGLATLASIHLFFQAGEPPTPTVALMDLQAGRTDSGPAEIAESATPAPDPIIIQLTLDRSASVLRYLEDAGLDPAQAQNWANHFQDVANTGTMKEGHALVLYKDPETGDLRDLRYDLGSGFFRRRLFRGSLLRGCFFDGSLHCHRDGGARGLRRGIVCTHLWNSL